MIGTSCNFCTFKRIKRRAEKAGHELVQRPARGGVEVFVCPPGEDIDELDEMEERRWFCAWFMALSDHCCC